MRQIWRVYCKCNLQLGNYYRCICCSNIVNNYFAFVTFLRSFMHIVMVLLLAHTQYYRGALSIWREIISKPSNKTLDSLKIIRRKTLDVLYHIWKCYHICIDLNQHPLVIISNKEVYSQNIGQSQRKYHSLGNWPQVSLKFFGPAKNKVVY